jgi:uncharacterized protein
MAGRPTTAAWPPFSAGLIQGLYRGPMGMNRTCKAAVAALMLAVSFAGSAAAGPFEDAVAAYNKGDYATALRLMRSLAEQGDASAQVQLGVMYDNGRGVPQDYATAVSWYRKAAEQGLATAQNYLGARYYTGRGVQNDMAAAVSWFRKAAEQGDASAQVQLGKMYGAGMGVPEDHVTAHMWFNLAAASGDETKGLPLEFFWPNTAIKSAFDLTAAEWRDNAAKYMTPAQIAEAQKMASEWKPK